MPKKFVGENSKAAAARARKTAVKEAEQVKKQKAAEDAYWQDDDKAIKKKEQKKVEMEKKKLQQQEKKAEAKAMLEKEMESIGKNTSKQPLAKITRAQIQAENEKRNAAVAATQVQKEPEKKTHIEQPLEENINRLQPEEVATTIDEALAILSTDDPTSDKHPEKRMKAAYTAFEEKLLKKLKDENPSLRLSQLKQMVRKEWAKSADNPMNKPTV